MSFGVYLGRNACLRYIKNWKLIVTFQPHLCLKIRLRKSTVSFIWNNYKKIKHYWKINNQRKKVSSLDGFNKKRQQFSSDCAYVTNEGRKSIEKEFK